MSQAVDVNNNVIDLSRIGLEWGYCGEYGPEKWCAKYPQAGGHSQSPIDVRPAQAAYDAKLNKNPLKFSFSNDCFKNVLNSGSSFKVSGSDNAQSSVTGGPVKDLYRFAQFHMHWGADESTGSEHLIDGKSYAAELHFVNWNTNAYENVGKAAMSDKHDGLIVLGVLVKVGKKNEEMDKIINLLAEIPLRDQSTNLRDALNVQGLFPEDTSSYWTYQGSLTTPPCTESVQWVLFKEPIEISSQQLDAFRKLYQCKNERDCCDSFRMVQNFRPVCELNQRKLFKSFN